MSVESQPQRRNGPAIAAVIVGPLASSSAGGLESTSSRPRSVSLRSSSGSSGRGTGTPVNDCQLSESCWGS